MPISLFGCSPSRPGPVDFGGAAPLPPIGWLLRGKSRQPIVRAADGTGILPGGEALIDSSARPLAPDQLTFELDEGSLIWLRNGALFGLVTLDGTRRWLPPAHSRAEIDRREATLAAEAALLPASLRATIARRLRLFATVSVTEGDFAGVATRPKDTAASVGIFQWAMNRRRLIEDSSSLSRLFEDLKRRAVDCDDSEDRALYCGAWREFRSTALDLHGSRFWLRGRPAMGDDVVRALAPAMGRGALRTYQLVAAGDWVERIASLRVATDQGSTTVGALLQSERALATAVLLGVNRPAYVTPALSRALAHVGAADEDRLVCELRKEALARYRPQERERRAARLLTSDAAFVDAR